MNRCIIIPNSNTFVSPGEDLAGAQRLAILAVDFSKRSSRSAAGLAEPCQFAADARPRLSRNSTQDAADRARIAAAIVRHGLASRQGRQPFSDAPGPSRPHGRGRPRPSPY